MKNPRRERTEAAAARALGGMLVLLLSGVLGTAFGAQKSVNESRPAQPGGTVEVENAAGSVKLSGWDKSEVSVEGTLDPDATLEFTTEGDRTVIRVQLPKGGPLGIKHRRFGSEKRSDLVIRVPAESSTEVQTVSADVSVLAVNGSADLQTVSGNIQVGSSGAPDARSAGKVAPKRVEAQTVSGNIEIDAASTRTSASTVSGTVNMKLTGGEVEANAVSGNIRIEGGRFDRADVSAVSGDVLFDGDFGSDGRYEFSTHSGTVELRLPARVSAEIDASSYSGDIINGFGGKPEGGGEPGGKELGLTLGAGDARVEVSTFSGAVKLVKK